MHEWILIGKKKYAQQNWCQDKSLFQVREVFNRKMFLPVVFELVEFEICQ